MRNIGEQKFGELNERMNETIIISVGIKFLKFTKLPICDNISCSSINNLIGEVSLV